MTWFIHSNEKILGPFSSAQIKSDLKDGKLSYEAHIWSKGQVEWLPIGEWEANLEKIIANSEQSKKLWKVRAKDKIVGDLKFDQVIKTLKTMKSLNMVSVSPQESEDWAPVYSSYSFMEALKLSRRNFLRAPLMGLSKITRDGSRFSYVVRTATIGQGGIGVSGLGPNFEPGTHVALRVESENLNSVVNVNGTVVYNTDQGFIGIRFGKLPAESSAVIHDYMKQFHEQAEDSDSELQKAG